MTARYKHGLNGIVIDQEEGWHFVPYDPASSDPPNQVQGLYAAWLNEGNEPDPADPEPEP